MYAFNAYMHLFSRLLPLLLFLQRFPAHTVYLSWYIQIMNTRSQQVWTQLLNIQPLRSFLLPPSFTISAFSHLKLSLFPLVSRSSLSFSLPASVALHSSAASASALCAPLSLRGSPLIALHITLNHHNNKSTLPPTNHLEGPALKILR